METHTRYNRDRELLSVVSEDETFEFRMTKTNRDSYMFTLDTDISPDTFLERTEHRKPQIESSEISDNLLDKIESFINGKYGIVEQFLANEEEQIDEIYFEERSGETFYGWREGGELYVLSDAYRPEEFRQFFESVGADTPDYISVCEEAVERYDEIFDIENK